jgi:alkylation response protein AidB-like acyl-CoA dehydrogenase
MTNYYRDNLDLRFYVEEWVDWEALVRLNEYDFNAPDGFASTEEAVSFYEDVLDMVGDFVGQVVAPVAATIDHAGLTFEDGQVHFPPELDTVFKKIRGLDLHGMCVPRELGGLNCPLLLYLINTEIFSRADVSIAAHHGFHGGMAMAMLAFSVHEGSATFDADTMRIDSCRFTDEIQEIIAGKAWGSMDITEAHAGSDMAALRTKGEQDSNGDWFVTGQKIFITSGHGKYHFVIARTEEQTDLDDPLAGLKGLSFFLVPATGINDAGEEVQLATFGGIERKLGHHASATVVVNFDRTPAQLIGSRGEGFKHMLLLMNNARVGVGFECIGLCENALRMAQDYASERLSMGKTINKHELIADMLDEMTTDLLSLRAMAFHGAIEEELSRKKEMAIKWLPGADKASLAQEVKEHQRRARRVTPLLKYLAAEKAVEMARRNLQIHGGVGYTKEYGAEKLLRDAMVMPIYEGTSQIQALMAMKDTLLGILRAPKAFVKRLAQARWRSLSSRDPLERRLSKLQSQSLGVQQNLLQRTVREKVKGLRNLPLGSWSEELLSGWDPKKDFSLAKLHSERLIRILADEMIAELLFEQATAYPERRWILEAHLDRAEPRVSYLVTEIHQPGTRLLASIAEEEEHRIAG